MKKINYTTKAKAILFGILVVVSIALTFKNIYNSEKSSKGQSQEQNVVQNQNFAEIESKAEDIIELDVTPSYIKSDKKTIWIKNSTFLAEQGVSYNTLMMLKSKLNTELRVVNEDIYEVELLEDTYEKTDNGFTVKAKVDTIENNVIINYAEYEFNFIIEE